MILSQVLSEVYITLKSMIRSRDVFFWVILFPIIVTMIFIGIFARGDEGVTFTIAVESRDSGWFNDTVHAVLNATGIFDVRLVDSGVEELAANGSVDAGLYIPEGVSGNLSAGRQAWVRVYYVVGVQESEVAKANLEGVLAALSRNISMMGVDIVSRFMPEPFAERILFLAEPLVVKDEGVEPEILATVGGWRAYYAISIIGIQALYIGIFSSISMVVERRKDKVFPVILSSPVRGWVLFLSDTLATILLIFASTLVVMLTSLAMGADFSRLEPSKLALSLAFISIGTLSMVGIGLTLSILAKTPEGAAALGNLVAFPMMFIGGFTIPKFLLPEQLQLIADWFPLSRIIDAVRNITIFNYTINEAINYAAPAIIAATTIYTIGALIYKNILTKITETPN